MLWRCRNCPPGDGVRSRSTVDKGEGGVLNGEQDCESETSAMAAFCVGGKEQGLTMMTMMTAWQEEEHLKRTTGVVVVVVVVVAAVAG